MTLLEKIRLIERTDALIRRKSTGTPRVLASRLNLSERYVYKLINLMKDMGAPIYYDNHRQSYCYEKEVEFSIGFVEKDDQIFGGRAMVYNFFEDFFQTARFVQ